MKKTAFPVLIILFLLLSHSDARTEQDGAQAGNAGAPGNDTCATNGCHDTFEANSGNGSISVMTPDQFSPGDTVSFTVKVAQDNASRFGFQATIRRASEPRVVGKLILGENTRFPDAIGDYITHAEAVDASGSAEWFFQWKAPDQDAEDIIIYVAGVAGNGSGTRFGDRVYTTTATLPINVGAENERPLSSFEVEPAYPNPFRQRVFVRYALHHPEPVRIALYDALGRVIETIDQGYQPAGRHEVLIEGGRLPAGTYYYDVRTPSQRETRMMTRIR